MGVTIHYSGRIEPKKIRDLVRFLERVCAEHKFEYRLVHLRNEKGIVLTIDPKCDPVWFVFGNDGRFSRFTKTQFAGMKAHATVCGLLHVVKDMFIPDLVVKDEAGFWKTNDFKKLAEFFTDSAVLFDQAVERLEKGKK